MNLSTPKLKELTTLLSNLSPFRLHNELGWKSPYEIGKIVYFVSNNRGKYQYIGVGEIVSYLPECISGHDTHMVVCENNAIEPQLVLLTEQWDYVAETLEILEKQIRGNK